VQAAINNLSDGYTDPQFFPIVETKYGDRYYRLFINDIINTFEHYPSLATITKDDIVFDIGAFIGGFAIPAARRAKMVYAFEPLYWAELFDNTLLNNLRNIYSYPVALGQENGKTDITYFKTKTVGTNTFKEMKEQIGVSPTYLKCNCEGAEWFLKPEDFEGIKTIEIQFHYGKGITTNPALLLWLYKNYTCTGTTTQTDNARGIYQVRDVHGSKSNRI
jgi:hypothetical protein